MRIPFAAPRLRSTAATLAASAASLLFAFAGTSTALAQEYPAKPVRIIIPYPAGGVTDVVTRLLAAKMSASMGQPVVIDNRSGGATMLGTGIAARSPADGYTLMATANVFAVNVILRKNPSYKVEDFAPVAIFGAYPYALVVHPSLPVKTVAELIDYARKQPGKLNAVSLGPGGVTHLLTERFEALAGVPITDIHYRGGAPAMTDLLSNQVQMYFDTLTTSLQHIRTGQLRLLAVTTEERSPLVPDAPTFKELGYPLMTQRGWLGLFAPAGTPKPIIDRLNAEVRKAVAADDVRARFANDGFVPVPYSPEQFATFIREDLAPWERIVKQLNITVED